MSAKPRHIKTLTERFGSKENIATKEDLVALHITLKRKVIETRRVNQEKLHSLEEILAACNISYDGVFYLEGLGKYTEKDHSQNGVLRGEEWTGYIDCCDAYHFQEDDIAPLRVNLTSSFKEGDKEYMEYVKYFVMGSSLSGWTLVWFEDCCHLLDFKITKNEILLEGNIGTLIR